MPRWYNDSGDGVSSISSDPVHQMPVNSSTQLLRIAAYTDLYSGRYTCRSTVNSVQLAQSIVLTTGKCCVVCRTGYLRTPIHLVVPILCKLPFNLCFLEFSNMSNVSLLVTIIIDSVVSNIHTCIIFSARIFYGRRNFLFYFQGSLEYSSQIAVARRVHYIHDSQHSSIRL